MCAPTNGNEGVGITTATVEIGDDGSSLQHVYTSGFGGTSSAAPLCAGICALMLTANPNLTVPQLRGIFKQTTDKIVGGYDANGHSRFLGYGRVNALNALKMALQLAGGTPIGDNTSSNTGSTTPPPPPAPSATPKGKVISKFVNVRSGPSTANPKVGELKQGDVVNLLEKSGGFWRIGTGQFVSADFVQVLVSNTVSPTATPPPTRKGKVTTTFLNVRNGPSTANAKVAELKQGAMVSIFETSSNGWHRIGSGQWVIGSNVQEV